MDAPTQPDAYAAARIAAVEAFTFTLEEHGPALEEAFGPLPPLEDEEC